MFTQPEQLLKNELVAQLVAQGILRVAVTNEVSMLVNLETHQGFII